VEITFQLYEQNEELLNLLLPLLDLLWAADVDEAFLFAGIDVSLRLEKLYKAVVLEHPIFYKFVCTLYHLNAFVFIKLVDKGT
jgi:hypothetical protein